MPKTKIKKKKPKTAFCSLFLGLLMLSGASRADVWLKGVTFSTDTSGGIDEKAAFVIGLDSSTGAYRTLQVDPTGALKTNGAGGNVSITGGTVTLSAGTNYIGAVGVSNSVAVSSGTNYIGSVGVSNSVAVAAGTNYIGAVGISNSASIAQGTNYIGAVGVSNSVAIAAGTNYIGAVGVSNSVAIASGTNYIGAVGVSNSVAIASGTNYIGAVGVSNTVSVTQGASGSNPWPVSVAAQAGYTRLTQTAYTGVTLNATVTLGLTATAGTSAYKTLYVKMWVKSGVVSVNALIHPTATPPVSFASGVGPEYFPSDNAKLVDFPVNINDGNTYYLSFIASALTAASGTVFFQIWGQ